MAAGRDYYPECILPSWQDVQTSDEEKAGCRSALLWYVALIHIFLCFTGLKEQKDIERMIKFGGENIFSMFILVLRMFY